MVQKISMSRRYLILIIACVLAGFSTGAFAVDESIRSEIIYRASFGRADDIKLLVEQGASPDQLNSNNVPIIAVAAVRNDPEAVNVIKTLLDLGANINAVDMNGQNALFYAAKAGNVDAINLLLQKNIDFQAVDAKGNNARSEAAAAGHQNVIDILDDFPKKHAQELLKQKNEAMLQQKEKDKQAVLKAAEDTKKAAQIEDTKKAAQVAQALQVVQTQEAEELVAITDKESKKVAEEKVKDATLSLTKTPEAVVNDTQVKEPFEIDEKKLEDAAIAQAEVTAAEVNKQSSSLTPDQQREFNAIIKHGIYNDTLNVDEEDPDSEEEAIIKHITPAEIPEENSEQGPAKASPKPAKKTPEELAAKAENAKQAREDIKRTQDEIERKRKKEIKAIAYEVAYHTCAFQYWVYVLQVRQSTELASEELTISIQTQKEAAESQQKKLLVDYHLPASFYDDITKSAQLRIYGQLNSMPSNRSRHENGIGKMDDMENRCEEIARQWGFPASYKSNPTAVPNDGKGANSRMMGHTNKRVNVPRPNPAPATRSVFIN